MDRSGVGVRVGVVGVIVGVVVVVVGVVAVGASAGGRAGSRSLQKFSGGKPEPSKCLLMFHGKGAGFIGAAMGTCH